MTPQESEKLFAVLQAAHPRWSAQFCSGFVHGARDEAEHKKPPKLYVDRPDQYARGYLTGFALYRGSDAECQSWFDFVGTSVEGAHESS